MPKISKKNVFAGFLYLLFLPFVQLSSVEHRGSSNTPVISSATTTLTTSSSLLPSVTTCESRTANYITHNLPQQCLRANWTRSINSTALAGGDLNDADLSSASTHALDDTGATRTEGDKTTEAPSPATAPEEYPLEPNSVPPSPQETSTTQVAPDPGPSSSPSSDSTSSEAEAETDSPLDNAKFLSFEEWKKQNLAKIGQSPENVGQGRASASDGRKRPSPINNALDSLGEDGEIELEFGFGPGQEDESTSRWSSQSEDTARVSDVDSETAASGSRENQKDAGTTCKERFNYASFDCAATILKTNPQCKSSSSVLVENKDSYMLNECSAENKFLIVELCDDILIDTIVLANFEFFSSMFRTFRVSISDRYPVKMDRWKELGVFEARNSRDIQAFAVQNPLIWARYLRIEFLTHYGNEFYCPVSLLRVHGTTMMEEFRSQDELGRSDDEVENEEIQQEEHPSDEKLFEVRPAPEPASTEEQKVASIGESEFHEMQYEQEVPIIAGNLSDVVANTSETNLSQSGISSTPATSSASSSMFTSQTPETSNLTANISTTLLESSGALPEVKEENATASLLSATTPTPTSGSSEDAISSPSVNDIPVTADSPSVHNMTLSGSTASATDNGTTSKPSQASQESSKIPSSSVQAPAASPTTQESFFKSIHKRLQMLEANSTLSLQYIEEQSRILRDAFTKVEKRQTSKAETFLQNLNDTVIAELKGFRQQYDQLWQSTVIELETSREQYQREMSALSTRLTLMADELVFQKRMAVVQSTLLLLCLGLVLFVRSGTSSLELPLMQQVMSKSHSMLRLPFDSPPGSPSSRDTSPPSKTRRFFGGTNSRDSDASAGSLSPPLNSRSKPVIELAPATPSDDDEEMMNPESPGDGLDAPVVRQTQSGPATPRGTRENQNPLEWIDGEEGQSLSPPLLNGDRPANNRRASPLRNAESLDDDSF